MIDNVNHKLQAEIELIKEKAIADNTFMTAPNGQDTKLSEEQWLQVRTKAFKEWFGDWELDEKGEKSPNASKVVDENGEPMVVYHGSPISDWNTFDESKINPNDPDAYYNGFWFSTSFEEADGAGKFPYGRPNSSTNQTRAFFLNIRNPLSRKDANKIGIKVKGNNTTVRHILKNKGFDGVFHRSRFYATSEIEESLDKKEKVKRNSTSYIKKNPRSNYIELYDRNVGGFVTDYNSLEEYIKLEGYGDYVAFSPNQIKSAIDKNIAFSLDNDDIRFRFIGEIGATNLDKAEEATHRLDNLNVAREMEKANKDEKTIKMATGWERGVRDSKWRYEVEDFSFYLMHEHESFRNHFDNTKKSFIIKGGNPDHPIPLERYLGCFSKIESLFKAYPSIKDVVLSANSTENKGYYNQFENIIININPNFSKKEVESFFNHKIQHIIQFIEGFAKGGNPKDIELAKYLQDKEKITDYHYALKDYFESSEGLEINKIRFDFFEKNLNPTIEEINAFDDELSEKYPRYNQLHQAGIEAHKEELRPFTLSQVHYNIAGEIEARNVESRLGWTDQKRRKYLARETEDVEVEDQIILENDLGLNMSRSIEKLTHSLHNIEQAVDEISKILGVVVEKVESREHLPIHLQNLMKNQGRYPGVYDPKTENVYLVLSDILNEDDAKATILHEVLGHKGLRALKGKGFEKFLNDVCESMPSNKREEYLKRFDNNKLLATEEYLAEFAEGYKNPSAWEKVKAIFNNFLRKTGINIKISDGDLMYTFKRAKNKLTPSYSKENTSKAVTITPTKTTTGKDIFIAQFGVTFKLDTYKKMIEPLIKANAGTWDKKYKAVLFSKLASAVSFKNSLSEKILNKEIPILAWKKEKIIPSPTIKSRKI